MKSLLSKDEKTKLLETFRSSGQTQAAFAEVNGINPKTLAKWIYQQRLEARQNQNNVELVELKRTDYTRTDRNAPVRNRFLACP